jgi:acetoin utilization deacetylase AcuC-like enzyme
VPIATTVVWSDDCLLHEPDAEIWIGLRTAAAEVPARATIIRDALRAEAAPFIPAEPHPDEAILRVHDAELVDYLSTAWERWVDAGLPDDPGQDRVVPYVFAHAGLMSGRAPHLPTAEWARPGYFAYDTMTLVGPGTWPAARAAADVALTAVELSPRAYACTRPPGHHVCRGVYGGSCYLNNAAIAAAAFAVAGARVGVLDVDAHHGNGTQEIFYERSDVRTASVHVDPGAGWFPHFLGFADEDGNGANRNVALAPRTGDEEWLQAISSLVDWIRDVDALVVALGVDAAEGDPESPLRVSVDGYRSAGRLVGGAGLPTVIVQEGGYDLERIGKLVVAFLHGLEEATP